MTIAIFRGLQTEAVSVRLVIYVARLIMDLASGVMRAFSAGRQDTSRGTAPIEAPARLEFWNQVLGSSGLVDMGDRIRRQGRPRAVPSAQDNSLHQRLDTRDKEDDHLLEAGFMR